MLDLVLSMEVPKRGQTVNLGKLLLVPGLGPLIKRFGVCYQQLLFVSEILGKSEA